MPIMVSPDRFEELVSEAMDAVPDEFARHMENVAIVTADVPTTAQQRNHHGMLLGLYEGVMLTNRSPMSYQAVMPDRITIFRLAHLRLANTEAQLKQRITKTVIHEIGHHFGISDERLHELGW